ncbi:MAG: LamG-like jellyroll fold domain-containing protein, partial [Candidatus Roizmanbacteria bacterium]
YGYVPDDFITPPSPVTAYRGQWGLDETTSTDTNQFKASGYLDTGKLGQAVSVYGNAAGTAGSTLTFNRGAQISGNNYEHINTNQGTISFWVKPSWNGTDGLYHLLFMNKLDNNNEVSIYKSSTNNQIVFTYGVEGTPWGTTGTTITAGNWYHIVLRFSRNTVDGTNYADMRINNGTALVDTTAFAGYAPKPTSFIGTNDIGTNPAQALIDDFAIFDRVLPTTEITSLYNSGTGNEAGYVADSSLKFYAKMDGSGTLQPVTYNGGASASKMTRTSSELTGGTNLIPNGNFESATAGAPTGWAVDSGVTVADAESANILFDARSQKISVTAISKSIRQTLAVTPGQNYTYSFWMKTDPTYNAQIVVWDNINTTGIRYHPVTTTNVWEYISGSFKVPSGCTSIGVILQSSSNASYSFYVDNLTLTPNLVDNGGMEGTYVAGLAPGWSAFTFGGTPTLAAETTSIHSGTNSQKVTTGAANVGVYQVVTVVSGNWYMASWWLKVDSGYAEVNIYNGANVGYLGTASSSWTKINYIFKANSTTPILRAYSTNAATFYIDDVSVTPLDNVALSLKAWAPVSDSSAIGSSLSVQGSATGVQSLAAGVRNGAYTFDGSTGYLRQQTIATNIGTLSYSGNTFIDDAQTFTSYQAANPATHMIVITNSDNTTSWGYIGSGGSATTINVYTTKTESTAGFNGTSPTGKTPVGYEVRKTDFQITGAISMGSWIKTNSAANYRTIIGKVDTTQVSQSNYWLRLTTGTGEGFFRVYAASVAYSATGAISLADNAWHYIVGVYIPSTSVSLYVDGVLIQQNTTGIPAALDESRLPVRVGACTDSASIADTSLNYFFNGSIDEPFVTAEALTPGQIFDMYNSGR